MVMANPILPKAILPEKKNKPVAVELTGFNRRLSASTLTKVGNGMEPIKFPVEVLQQNGMVKLDSGWVSALFFEFDGMAFRNF
jgi:hypothetical protein